MLGNRRLPWPLAAADTAVDEGQATQCATTTEVACRMVSPSQRAQGGGGQAAITAAFSVKGYALEAERVAHKGASIVFELLKSI